MAGSLFLFASYWLVCFVGLLYMCEGSNEKPAAVQLLYPAELAIARESQVWDLCRKGAGLHSEDLKSMTSPGA